MPGSLGLLWKTETDNGCARLQSAMFQIGRKLSGPLNRPRESSRIECRSVRLSLLNLRNDRRH